MTQPEPYISHLNESALQVLNLGGAGSEATKQSHEIAMPAFGRLAMTPTEEKSPEIPLNQLKR